MTASHALDARTQVILVDDDPHLRQALGQTLDLAGLAVQCLADARQLASQLPGDWAGVVVSDIRMPGVDGLELLRQLQARDAELPVLLITGHGDVPLAVEAMRAGAYDFLEKPFASEALIDSVRRALAWRRLVLENRSLRLALADRNELATRLLGQSPAMQRLREQIGALAATRADVLILGETGAGKEVVARALHDLSNRRNDPFVAINAGALAESVVESELFGHEAGAFTGAQKRHPGRFERADGGTLFLDELATAPMLVQEKLLRVIEYGELERVGGSQPLQVNVRLVCATNADLPQMVQEGTFRADLLDRLAFDVVLLPPLRQRQSDIMLMADHFAIQMCRELHLPLFPGFTGHAREVLMNYAWPGNIRELKNVVERSVYRHGSSDTPLDTIILDPFRRDRLENAPAPKQENGVASLPELPLDLRQFQLDQEKNLLVLSLQQAEFNQKRAAERLGLTYHQLRALLKKHQIR